MILFLYIAAITCCNVFGQNQNINWAFGDSAGLNFSGIYPEYFKSGISTDEACAVISSNSGQLLFYTNGLKIWDKENEIMPNGDSLIISKSMYGESNSSTTQGATVITKPGDSNKYLIITMFQINVEGATDSFGINYTVVDMELNDGMGDVTDKNIPFYFFEPYEKMQAVKHANGRDWWLVILQSYVGDTSLCFKSFLITPFNISTPIDQCNVPGASTPGYGGMGQMKFSQDGTRLVVTRGRYFDLYDFDRCTGELSNCITVQASEPEYALLYGCEFSADGRKLYLTDHFSWTKKFLYQYCLDCPQPIGDTKKVIYELNNMDYYLGQLQIGPDHKIYMAHNGPANVYSELNQNLSVVQHPEGDSASCNFDTLAISLENARSTLALPNLPNYNLGALEGSACDTLISVVSQPVLPELQVFPNPASNYLTISATDETLLLANLNAITITTLSGVVVKTIRQPKSLTIYTGDLTAGFYLVTLTFQSGEAQNFKIIIQ